MNRDRSEQQVRVYRVNNRFGAEPVAALRALARELVDFRWHIAANFTNEFRAAYRGTTLGVVWNFIQPIVPIGVYVLLASLRVLPRYEGLSPAVYIGFNITLWYLLTGLIQTPISVVKSRTNEVMKTAMPLSAAIGSSFAQLLFDTAVRLAALLIMMIVFANPPGIFSPLIILVLLFGGAFCLGCGLLLAVLNVVVPDVERIVKIVLQYAIFVSGIIFPVSGIAALAPLEVINPFSVFIHGCRDVFFTGALTHGEALAIWSAIGAALFFASVRLFYVIERHLRGVA